MENNLDKAKTKKLIEKAKQQKKIKNYSDFCKTLDSQNMKLSEDEIQYYTSKNKKGD